MQLISFKFDHRLQSGVQDEKIEKGFLLYGDVRADVSKNERIHSIKTERTIIYLMAMQETRPDSSYFIGRLWCSNNL